MQAGTGIRMDALRSSSSTSASSSGSSSVLGGRSIVKFRVQRRHTDLGRSFVRHAKEKGPPKEPGEDPNPNKADFSAYWALKLKNLFSTRRKYLNEAERSTMAEPEIIKQMQKEEEQMKIQRDRLFWQEMEIQRQEIQQQQQALPASQAKAAEKLKPFERILGGPYDLPRTDVSNADIASDIDATQKEIRASALTSVGLALLRSRKTMHAFLMLPITIFRAIQKSWSSTFTSQEYENFLMSEGERIWFWRNRTENERWFWEVHFWNQILFPLLCAISYQLLTPAHIVWAVVIPFMFIKMESGRLPGIFELEFWLIMYFGLYKKCWGDVMSVVGLLRFGL